MFQLRFTASVQMNVGANHTIQKIRNRKGCPFGQPFILLIGLCENFRLLLLKFTQYVSSFLAALNSGLD